MLIKIVLLFIAWKLFSIEDDPLLGTAVYVIPLVILSLFFGVGFIEILISAVFLFAATYIIFWLLRKYNDGPAFYAIGVLGAGCVLFVL